MRRLFWLVAFVFAYYSVVLANNDRQPGIESARFDTNIGVSMYEAMYWQNFCEYKFIDKETEKLFFDGLSEKAQQVIEGLKFEDNRAIVIENVPFTFIYRNTCDKYRFDFNIGGFFTSDFFTSKEKLLMNRNAIELARIASVLVLVENCAFKLTNKGYSYVIAGAKAFSEEIIFIYQKDRKNAIKDLATFCATKAEPFIEHGLI